MKTLILYTSKTGATEKYVNWIQKRIENCTIQNIELIPDIDFNPYQTVIFALPTYAGQINKKEVLENNWNEIQTKNVYLIVVGGVPQEATWSQKSFNMIRKEVRENLKGYVKIIGLSDNPDKKLGKVERFFTKLFLGTDPDKIDNRREVYEDDLKAVWGMLGISE
jgi:menaquinone-dependent protoporphyrinogen IX oxidase